MERAVDLDSLSDGARTLLVLESDDVAFQLAPPSRGMREAAAKPNPTSLLLTFEVAAAVLTFLHRHIPAPVAFLMPSVSFTVGWRGRGALFDSNLLAPI